MYGRHRSVGYAFSSLYILFIFLSSPSSLPLYSTTLAGAPNKSHSRSRFADVALRTETDFPFQKPNYRINNSPSYQLPQGDEIPLGRSVSSNHRSQGPEDQRRRSSSWNVCTSFRRVYTRPSCTSEGVVVIAERVLLPAHMLWVCSFVLSRAFVPLVNHVGTRYNGTWTLGMSVLSYIKGLYCSCAN